MLQSISQNGRVRFSCVPEPARTVSKDLETRKKLVRERIGRIVQIHCQFLEGDVFLPNPAKHTDHIDVVSVTHPEESGWKPLTREHSVSFFDHEVTQTDSGHRDSVIVVSEKPLNRNVGIFLAPADCAIVGLAHRDPNVDFAALIHSGWKGTAKDIVGQTIDAVKTIFWSGVTSDLEAFVSPFAKSCCYEFGLDTFSDAFMHGRISEGGNETVTQPLWSKIGMPPNFGLVGRDGKTYLNSSVLLHQTLERHGISDERTKDLSICTVCEGHEKGYSSSRKDPDARFGVFLSLRKREETRE